MGTLDFLDSISKFSITDLPCKFDGSEGSIKPHLEKYNDWKLASKPGEGCDDDTCIYIPPSFVKRLQ